MGGPRTRGGFVLLLNILILIAVLGGLIGLATTLSLTTGRTSLTELDTMQARKLADTCMELALMELRESAGTYQGGSLFSFPSLGSCEIRPVTTGVGGFPLVRTTGTVRNVVKRLEVQLSQIFPQLQLSSWQEVVDFTS